LTLTAKSDGDGSAQFAPP